MESLWIELQLPLRSVFIYVYIITIILFIIMVFRIFLVLMFDITDHCVGMHSLQVNNYSNVLLLFLLYKSVINI